MDMLVPSRALSISRPNYASFTSKTQSSKADGDDQQVGSCC